MNSPLPRLTLDSTTAKAQFTIVEEELRAGYESAVSTRRKSLSTFFFDRPTGQSDVVVVIVIFVVAVGCDA